MQLRSLSLPARATLAAVAIAASSNALAQASDSILSRHLREADGTTGQDTNNGSGVKTGHLQNGAVTAPKLAPAAVGTAALQDGAVTPDKLAGPIPAAKIDRTGLDADSLDGYQAGDFSPIGHDHVLSEIQGLDAFRKKQANVLVVAKDGTGDFSDPAAALGSITNASWANPYLVKIMPGEYTIDGTLVVGAGVAVEGSGRSVTRIIGTRPDWYVAVVRFGGSVRELTIEGRAYQTTMLAYPTGDNAPETIPQLRNVTVVRRATADTTGEWNVILSYGALLDHVTIEAVSDVGPVTGFGTGIHSYGPTELRDCDLNITGAKAAYGAWAYVYPNGQSATLRISDSRISVVSDGAGAYPGGVYVDNGGKLWVRNTSVSVSTTAPDAYATVGVGGYGSVVEIDGSEISASGAAPTAVSLYDGASLANTKVRGPVLSSGGNPLRCIGLYDGATYTPVSCQ